jgi:small subunit ribosomal protein S29
MFNEKQGFHLMRRPVSVIRNNSGLVARELFAQDVSHLGTDKRRVLVTGKGGSGKSFILLQMATMALMQKYVVVAVPRGISWVALTLGMDLVDNRTSYMLDLETMRFHQSEYISNMLSRTRKACSSFLRNVLISATQLTKGRDESEDDNWSGNFASRSAVIEYPGSSRVTSWLLT